MDSVRIFAELVDLLEKNPDAYRARVTQLKRDQPEVFAAFLRELRAVLADEHDGRYRRYSSLSELVAGDPKRVASKPRRRRRDPRVE